EYQYDLALGGSAPATVTAGSNLTWTLTASNSGLDAVAGAVLSVPLPVGTSFVSLAAPPGWTVSQGTTLTATAASLAPGAAATLGPGAGDSVPGNNSVTFSSTVPTGVDIHGQPSNTTVGQKISPVRVAVVDAHGKTLDDSSTMVTLAVLSGPKGAKLGGTFSV